MIYFRIRLHAAEFPSNECPSIDIIIASHCIRITPRKALMISTVFVHWQSGLNLHGGAAAASLRRMLDYKPHCRIPNCYLSLQAIVGSTTATFICCGAPIDVRKWKVWAVRGRGSYRTCINQSVPLNRLVTLVFLRPDGEL